MFEASRGAQDLPIHEVVSSIPKVTRQSAELKSVTQYAIPP